MFTVAVFKSVNSVKVCRVIQTAWQFFVRIILSADITSKILFVKCWECSSSHLCPVFVLRTTSYWLRAECGDDALGVHLRADRCYASVCTWIAYIRFCFLCGCTPAVYHGGQCCMYVAVTSTVRLWDQSQSFLGAFAALRKATVSFFIAHGTTRQQLDRFSWNLIFEDCSKICRESFTFLLKSDKNGGWFTRKHCTKSITVRIWEWEMF
jgi:hypothetical protein